MWSPIRPSSLVLYLTVAIFVNGFAQKTDGFGGLSDFGGDVSQYMTLLQGTSAFRLALAKATFANIRSLIQVEASSRMPSLRIITYRPCHQALAARQPTNIDKSPDFLSQSLATNDNPTFRLSKVIPRQEDHLKFIYRILPSFLGEIRCLVFKGFNKYNYKNSFLQYGTHYTHRYLINRQSTPLKTLAQQRLLYGGCQ